MVNEAGNSARKNLSDKSSGEFYDKSRHEIEKYFIFAFFSLIAAVIFLSFGLKLISGILIIAGASIGLIIYRKVAMLSSRIKESLNTMLLS